MADNINNENSENLSDENSFVNATDIIIPNQETKNMEVHHHPDLHHKPKKWKEYFLEFLMIFLAVTMGFIAENIREHFTERKIARQNLEAYRNDLLQHQEYYKENIAYLNERLPIYDSIVSILYTKKENEELHVLSHLLLAGEVNHTVTINTPTYQQLINSGSLRFVDNKELKAAMANYQYQINNFINYNDRVVNTLNNMLGDYGKIVDTHDFWDIKKGDYIPEMKPFALSEEQRNFLIFHTKGFSVQFQVGLSYFNGLLNINVALLKLLDKELDK